MQYSMKLCTFLLFHLAVFVHKVCHSFQHQKVLVYYGKNPGYQLNYYFFTTLSESHTISFITNLL